VTPDPQRSESQTSSASARRLRQNTAMNGAGFLAYDLNGSTVFQIQLRNDGTENVSQYRTYKNVIALLLFD